MLKFPIGKVICQGEHTPQAAYVQTQEHKGKEEKSIESPQREFLKDGWFETKCLTNPLRL